MFLFLQVLNLSDKNAKLDAELEKIIAPRRAQLQKRRQEAEENLRKTNELRAHLTQIRNQSKAEMLEKDQQMEKFAQTLGTSHMRMRKLQDELAMLKEKRVEVRGDCVKYRDDAEKLERTRRLGYIHDRSVEGARGRGEGRRATSSTSASKSPQKKASKKPHKS